MALVSPDPTSIDVLDPAAPSPQTADAPAPTRRFEPWRWLAGALVVAGRWIFAADRAVFHVVPDEPAQLAMARWLGGGTRWNMFDHISYRPGHALVLAPVVRLAGSGETVVRAVLTVGALSAGLSAVLLAALIRRWTDLGPRAAALVALATALAPAAISASAYTWAEPSVTLSFLATLVALQRLIDDRRTSTAVLAVVLAAWAMTVHGRSLPLLPTTAVLAAVLVASRGRRAAAAAVLAVAAVLGALSLLFVQWVEGHVWEAPGDINSARTVIGQIDAPVALVDSAIGQTWYQLVATAGMFGVGVALVLGALVRPDARLGRWQAVSLVALITPLVLTSMAFMAGRQRPDQLVYGRYVDAVAWPLTALGIAWVVARLRSPDPVRPRAMPVVVGATTVATAAIVALRHGDQLASGVGLRMMVPGLLPFIGSGDGVPVLRITAVAVAAFALLLASARLRRAPHVTLIASAAVVLTVSAVRVHDAQALHLNTWDIGRDVSAIDEIVPPGTTIGVRFAPERDDIELGVQRQRVQLYQLYLPGHEFVWERTPVGAATEERFVISPQSSPELSAAGAVVRWRDPSKPMALWELPATAP